MKFLNAETEENTGTTGTLKSYAPSEVKSWIRHWCYTRKAQASNKKLIWKVVLA